MSFPIELHAWASRYGIPAQALAELGEIIGSGSNVETPGEASESNVQARVRLAARAGGMRLWRNNVGVLTDERGVPVRYGLANDTKQLNARLKSHDLIGWRRLSIAPEMVGTVVAQFVSLECKREGWRFTGNEREQAQQRWAALVASEGGFSRFVTGPTQITGGF